MKIKKILLFFMILGAYNLVLHGMVLEPQGKKRKPTWDIEEVSTGDGKKKFKKIEMPEEAMDCDMNKVDTCQIDHKPPVHSALQFKCFAIYSKEKQCMY